VFNLVGSDDGHEAANDYLHLCTKDVCINIMCTAELVLQTRGGGGGLALARAYSILMHVSTLGVPLVCINNTRGAARVHQHYG